MPTEARSQIQLVVRHKIVDFQGSCPTLDLAWRLFSATNCHIWKVFAKNLRPFGPFPPEAVQNMTLCPFWNRPSRKLTLDLSGQKLACGCQNRFFVRAKIQPLQVLSGVLSTVTVDLAACRNPMASPLKFHQY